MTPRIPLAALALALALPLAAHPAFAQEAAGAPEATAKRVEPVAPTEPVAMAREDLRVAISAIRSQRPNYDDMTPELARRVASQLGDMSKALKELGYVSTVEYVGVRHGAREFTVTFENGVTTWFISRGKDGKLDMLLFRRIADAPAAQETPEPSEAPPASAQ